MKLILLIILLLLNGCAPLFSAGGLMHSLVKNNTVSTVLGLGDTAVKETTGKSVGRHILDKVFKNDDLNANNKDIKWVFK